MRMERKTITIKMSILIELLKSDLGDIEEALKIGKIDIIDDFSNVKIGEISFHAGHKDNPSL